VKSVDDVAAIGRERHTAPRFSVGGARLGILAGHAADTDDRPLQPVHQHQAHLQQDLQPLRDLVGLAVVERLGAVASLQQERAPLLCLGKPLAQRVDFPGHHDRRQP
jgi:hypothetical protein